MESVWKTASFTLLQSREATLAELKVFGAAGRRLAEPGSFGHGRAGTAKHTQCYQLLGTLVTQLLHMPRQVFYKVGGAV